jgi:hypothetical protein
MGSGSRIGDLMDVVQALVMLRTLPSGSVNQATWMELLGTVKMPSSSWWKCG